MKNKKKIVFHINDMSRGGAQRVLSILIPKFIEKGIDVVLVTLWKADSEYILPDDVKRIDIRGQYGNSGRIGNILKRHILLRRIIKSERPSVVITFGEKACFRAAVSMAGIRTPLIISVRNNPNVSFSKHLLMTKCMELKASGCVFQTKDAMSFFSERLQKKSVIILNPLDSRFINIENQKNEKDYPRRIVTSGRIVCEKNHVLLMKAFAKLAEKNDDIILQIYGSKDNKEIVEELERIIRDNSLSERALLMGQVDNLENELQGASLFVLSSDSEGMPNSLMEAMALGLPVISTNCPCGGPETLIQNGINGILVPVGDIDTLCNQMQKVLDDNELADRLGDNAKSIREDANSSSIIGQWETYISQVANWK